MSESRIIGHGVRLYAEEEALLEAALARSKRCNTIGQSVYVIALRMADEQNLLLSQRTLDAYLEELGEKPLELSIPPLVLSCGYRLALRVLPAHTVLPRWWTRTADGAVLYTHRWWSTTAPARGWIEYGWFVKREATDREYERVSPWYPAHPLLT
jgi:hypothetical protein